MLIPLSLAGALWADDLLVAVVGDDFRGVSAALGPALGVLPLAPLLAAANQVSALRLRPEARLKATAVGTAVFLAAAAATIPWADAVGATAAMLAGTAATLVAASAWLPGALERRAVALGARGRRGGRRPGRRSLSG